MTDTPDYILGWHAAIEAAAKAVSMAAWKHCGDDAYSVGMEDGARRQSEDDYAAIRALPPPGDLRAALAALVKPLVWEGHSDDQRSGDYVITPSYGQGPKRLLLARGSKLVGWFDELELARAAAEADYCRRVVAAIMGDEG